MSSHSTLQRPAPAWLVATLSLAMSAVLLALAARSAAATLAALEGTGRVIGVVVDEVGEAGGRRTRSASGTMVVGYRAHDGRDYRVVASYPSGRHGPSRGDPFPVRYKLEHPEDARIDTFRENWFATLGFGVPGLLLAGLGAGLLVVDWRRRRLRAWLLSHGRTIEATISAIDVRTLLNPNGRPSYRLRAHWRDPLRGETHVLRSERVWFDPGAQALGRTVTVHIDPDRPRRHWMDIAFLRGEG